MQHIFVWRLEDTIGVVLLGVFLLVYLAALVVHVSKRLWHKLTGKHKH